MKILLVEDDVKISSFVKLGLEDQDFHVTAVYDSQMAEKVLAGKEFDLIILDIILPGQSGFELCKKIRETGATVPILMLTSLDSVDDKVTGLNFGADDYMVKPFSFKELLARINALTRRSSEKFNSQTIRISGVVLDAATKKVFRNDHEVKLTAKEFSILELLMQSAGKVVDRQEISEKIWGFSFSSGTNLIDVHINSLRNKIDKGFTNKLIQTVVGFGYTIVRES